MSSLDDCISKHTQDILIESGTESENLGQISLNHQNFVNTGKTKLWRNYWILDTVLPSIISSSVCQYLRSSPILSVLIFPVVQFTLDSILHREPLAKMQSALSALYKFVNPSSPTAAESGCAGLLRDLVLAQERTMFYTVTLNPTPPQSASHGITKQISPNLKWQCASALSRSQSVLQRTNSNSMQYYTFTYLGEMELPSNDVSVKVQKDYSPVRIYINS